MNSAGTKSIHVGARVRIADAATLAATLRRANARRPDPSQMPWAGRRATVAGYRRDPEGGALYRLKDAPGLWPGEWLEPL